LTHRGSPTAYPHPYRWRTWLRGALPRPLCWWFDKGEDCESAGAEHHWYNKDDERSACYHCRAVREGRLWERVT